MNKEEEVRAQLLMPLKELAKARGVCVVFLGHLNKRGEEATVLQRGMGAQAFTGVPRKVFLFGPDPHEDDQYAHVMKETRDKKVAIKYKTVAVADPAGIQKSPIITVQWGGASDADADEIANAPKSRVKKDNKEAQDTIEKLLSQNKGVVSTIAIEKALQDAGIVCPAWQRAARRIPAKSRQIKGHGKGAGSEWYRLAPEQAEFDLNKCEKEALL
jgi:chemotaxis response regulator CheB